MKLSKRDQDKEVKILSILETGSSAQVIEQLDELDLLTPKIIKELADLVLSSSDPEITVRALSILRNIKAQPLIDALVEFIATAPKSAIKFQLVSACWESGNDLSNHLDFFVKLAIKEDYTVCLECLTIIENNVESADQAMISGSLKDLDKAIIKKDNKTGLYSEMKKVLMDLQIRNN